MKNKAKTIFVTSYDNAKCEYEVTEFEIIASGGYSLFVKECNQRLVYEMLISLRDFRKVNKEHLQRGGLMWCNTKTQLEKDIAVLEDRQLTIEGFATALSEVNGLSLVSNGIIIQGYIDLFGPDILEHNLRKAITSIVMSYVGNDINEFKPELVEDYINETFDINEQTVGLLEYIDEERVWEHLTEKVYHITESGLIFKRR